MVPLVFYIYLESLLLWYVKHKSIYLKFNWCILQTPSRDVMLNEFIQKKNQMGTVLRNVEEMTKLKRYVNYSGGIK